ncbi:MAG: hypothetical protein H6667_06340 [Ardenticatenaceae bacterium]|nr:hypothetical protein [Ardenticatenaceae bacterium]MCB9442800.1 hypothetical protein [Ardenticatenaceae bacterium]
MERLNKRVKPASRRYKASFIKAESQRFKEVSLAFYCCAVFWGWLDGRSPTTYPFLSQSVVASEYGRSPTTYPFLSQSAVVNKYGRSSNNTLEGEYGRFPTTYPYFNPLLLTNTAVSHNTVGQARMVKRGHGGDTGPSAWGRTRRSRATVNDPLLFLLYLDQALSYHEVVDYGSSH